MCRFNSKISKKAKILMKTNNQIYVEFSIRTQDHRIARTFSFHVSVALSLSSGVTIGAKTLTTTSH